MYVFMHCVIAIAAGGGKYELPKNNFIVVKIERLFYILVQWTFRSE